MPFTNSSLTIRLKGELPPSPPLPTLAQTLACQYWPFSYFEHCRDRYGDTFTAYPIGMAPLVFLSDPADIRSVLTAPATVLHPGAGASVISPLVGNSSFMLQEEDQHMCGRAAIMPAFRRDRVAEHTARISELVANEISSWQTGSVFVSHPRLRSLALRVILEITFDREHAITQELHRRLLIVLSATASLVLRESWLRRLPGWRARWAEFIVQRQHSDELIFSLISHRRHEGHDRGDVLDMLLESTNPDGTVPTDQQIRDHLMSVILAGHETTSSQIAWAFQLLAHNPSVQERLIEEIEQGGEEYLAATVQEVLRDRPVFLFTIPRAVIEPIEIGDYVYRPPVQLLGCIYLLHHDPEIYPDPHRFQPERFLGKPPPSREWLPWGGGRKRCPGHTLATHEMHLVLRTVLERYRLLPAGGQIERPRWRSVIVTPHQGSRVILSAREIKSRTVKQPRARWAG